MGCIAGYLRLRIETKHFCQDNRLRDSRLWRIERGLRDYDEVFFPSGLASPDMESSSPTCDFPVLGCVEIYTFGWRLFVTEQETWYHTTINPEHMAQQKAVIKKMCSAQRVMQ